VAINLYSYSQIDAIISSTNPNTVHTSYMPHMVDMGCNKAKIKTNVKDIATLHVREFNASTSPATLRMCR
jgi:hypothetical protein